MGDNSEYWRKPDRPCARGCDRAATLGYDTCAPCRVAPLVARFFPGQGVEGLGEARAARVERALRDADAGLDVARNVFNEAHGAPTVCVPEGDDVRRTFGLDEGARDAR